MRVLASGLKLKILGAGRAWPGESNHSVQSDVPISGPARRSCQFTNLELLSRHPDTLGKPPALLQGLSERIERAYGFRERHLTHFPGSPFSAEEATSESLAMEAVKKAAASRVELPPSCFILGSTTSRRYTGSQAASVLGKLGWEAPAYEIKAGCSTSLASLNLSFALLAGGYPDALVSCAETLSKVIHPENRDSWFGMADGGAALWLSSVSGGDKADFEVLGSVYSTDGRHVDAYTTSADLPPDRQRVDSGGYFLDGDAELMKDLALARYAEMIESLLPTKEARRKIRWVIPHQVNRAIIDAVRTSHGLEGQVLSDALEFGNIGGASVLFTFVHAWERRVFQPGDEIFLMSVGGGLSFAAQHWRCL